MTSSLLSLLINAADTPITKEIDWGKDVPVDHPIRMLLTHVRLFPNSEAAKLKKFADDLKAKNPTAFWMSESYWWCVAMGLAKADGTTPFTQTWNDLCANKKWKNREIDYKLLGEHLQEKFDTPAGNLLMMAVWNNVMDMNGYIQVKENAEAKK